MHYKRADRVAALIQEEISKLLLMEIQDPDVKFITITKVKVTDDIRHAKVYYSVLDLENHKEKAQAALDRVIGPIKGALGKHLKLRFMPEIAFYYDDSAEYAHHIDVLLKKIKTEEH